MFLFIIDGPDNVSLSISGHHVSVTQGRQLGPITCSAVCYLECDYIWKRFKNGVYSTVIVGQNFTIHSAAMDDSGPYICYVTHKNDTSRIGTTPMDISVEGKFDICKTFDKTSLTPPLFIEVSVPSQEQELSCTSMSVRGIYFVSISTNLVFDFGIVPTVWNSLLLICLVLCFDDISPDFFNKINTTCATI
jgi:hypothetical protein